MPAPSFVHLRLHSEFSVVDSTVRIDDAVAAAAADGMPRAGAHRPRQRFGLIKFYKAARGAASSPSPAATCGSRTTPSAMPPFRAILLAADRAGYLRLCDWLSRAYRDQPASRPRRAAPRVVRRRAPTGSSRCPAHVTAMSAARWLQGNAARCRPRGARVGRAASRSATTSKCSAPGIPTTTRSSPPPWRSPASSRCPSSRRIPCSS